MKVKNKIDYRYNILVKYPNDTFDQLYIIVYLKYIYISTYNQNYVKRLYIIGYQTIRIKYIICQLIFVLKHVFICKLKNNYYVSTLYKNQKRNRYVDLCLVQILQIYNNQLKLTTYGFQKFIINPTFIMWNWHPKINAIFMTVFYATSIILTKCVYILHVPHHIVFFCIT